MKEKMTPKQRRARGIFNSESDECIAIREAILEILKGQSLEVHETIYCAVMDGTWEAEKAGLAKWNDEGTRLVPRAKDKDDD